MNDAQSHNMNSKVTTYRESQVSYPGFVVPGAIVVVPCVLIGLLGNPFPDLEFFGIPLAILLWVLLTLPLLLLCMGLQTAVESDCIVVSLGPFCVRGLFCIPALSIPFNSVSTVEETTFRHRDFVNGREGKGDIGRKIVGFFVKGDQGVLICTHDGKKYLIGSQTPDRLLKAVEELL